MGVTVKDVPAKEFIEAFAKHLKKGNKIKMPEVSLPSRSPRCFCKIDTVLTLVFLLLSQLILINNYINSGPTTIRLDATRTSPHMMPTGST